MTYAHCHSSYTVVEGASVGDHDPPGTLAKRYRALPSARARRRLGAGRGGGGPRIEIGPFDYTKRFQNSIAVLHAGRAGGPAAHCRARR
ncbi:hypothetical protein EVAR_36262_1 [Eumeta japonica]|uniref:Uncharacterized protein n=1 Tax=Eumeta variegata TaxID=151549 RepID=A0A4C1WZN9_EUMVA|nr:hypothetical protein EVAR_36262_1 [Eumeta japonica]